MPVTCRDSHRMCGGGTVAVSAPGYVPGRHDHWNDQRRLGHAGSGPLLHAQSERLHDGLHPGLRMKFWTGFIPDVKS